MMTSKNGLSGSVTHACRGKVVMGSRTPAMSAMVVHQPAVAFSTMLVLIRPRLVCTPTTWLFST